MLGWPEGPGFWLVLRHRDVESVLTRPELFSSALGATQTRDPATPEALGYVRRMMLNMDPPEHSRLRRLLSGRSRRGRSPGLRTRSAATRAPSATACLPARAGECDFAKDLAADLPLLALADVLGVPEQDRWLLFDWSNRVIGYQDPDYAASAEFDPAAGTPDGRRGARACARCPTPADGCPTRGPARECPTCTPTPTCWRSTNGRHPGDDVMSILLAQTGRERRPSLRGGVREHVLAIRRGRQRDTAKRPAWRLRRAA